MKIEKSLLPAWSCLVPGLVTVRVSYKQSPISGPSVEEQLTELEEEPQVKGGASSMAVKSSLIWWTRGLH